MKEASNNSETKPSRFSFGWCIAAFFLHLTGTLAIAGSSFIVGMGAFTTNSYGAEHIHGEIAFWQGVRWIWTPLAMAAWDPHQSLDTGLLVGLALIWSCIIGVIAGLVVPMFRRWLHRPLYPPAAPNDNIRNA